MRNLFSRRKSAPLLATEPELRMIATSHEASRSRDALTDGSMSGRMGFRNITSEVRENKLEGRRVIKLDEPLFPQMRTSQASSAMTRNGVDTAASSLRHSSTSTEPSSFETDDRVANRPHNTRSVGGLGSLATASGPKIEDTRRITFAMGDMEDSSSRERGMTTSSYASTAVPPKLESFSTGDAFDDNMFAGFGEQKQRSVGLAHPAPSTDVPRLPPPTFQRADSEPTAIDRRHTGMYRPDVTKMPSPTLLDPNTQPVTPVKPTDVMRTSTDRLMDYSSTGPSTPNESPRILDHGSEAHVPSSTASVDGYSNVNLNEVSVNRTGTQIRNVAHAAPPEDSEHQLSAGDLYSAAFESRPSSSDSFNASMLAFADDTKRANRRMTQADYEKLMEREKWEEKQRIKHSARAEEEIDEYYDPEEDERAAHEKEREVRERRAAQLAVHRQKIKKAVGREATDSDASPLGSDMFNLDGPLASSPSTHKARETTTDTHQLQYHHNMSDDDRRKSVLPLPSKEAPSIASVRRSSRLRNSDSGDDDDDVPLHLVMEAKYNKNPENANRISSIGSHATGRSSIVPSVYAGSSLGGITNPIPPRPKSSHSALPAFAKNLPMDPFQYGAPPLPRMSTAPGFAYQDSFGGGYKAQPPGSVLGGRTLMDSIQDEEQHRKDLNKSRAKATGHNSMMPGSPLTPMMGYGSAPASPYMSQPGMMNPFEMQMQMQMLQMQMNNLAMGGMGMGMPMGMGMGVGMGMGAMSPQQEQQMLQMQQQQQQMNLLHLQQQQLSMQQAPQIPPPQQNPSFNPHRTSTMSTMLSPMWQTSKTPGAPEVVNNRFSQMAPLGSASNISGNYAPSLAPSERSNVGIARRYRPVTNVGDGASTVGDTVVTNTTPYQTTAAPAIERRASKGDKIKAFIGKRFGGHSGTEDDYEGEDEGDDWGKMMRQRVRRTGATSG